jgi:hypothetical protein
MGCETPRLTTFDRKSNGAAGDGVSLETLRAPSAKSAQLVPERVAGARNQVPEILGRS